MFIKRLFLILLVLFSLKVLHARIFYVDRANGNDNNNGLYETNQSSYNGPKATLRNASWYAVAGDTIQLADGILYGEYENWGCKYGSPTSMKGGKASTQATYDAMGLSETPLGEHVYDPKTWVTVKAKHAWNEPGHEAEGQHTVIDGNNYDRTKGLGISNTRYVKFTGFEIKKTKVSGIDIGAQSHDLIIENMWIHDIANIFIKSTNWAEYSDSQYGRFGILTSSLSYRITINRNVIHDVGRLQPARIHPYTGETLPAQVDPVTGETVSYPHTVIYRDDNTSTPYYLGSNILYHDESNAWERHDHLMYTHGSFQIISNNLMYNSQSGYALKFEVGPGCAAINNTFAYPGLYTYAGIRIFLAGASEYTYDCLVQNNILYGGWTKGILATPEYGKIKLQNNICYENPNSNNAGNGIVYDGSNPDVIIDGNIDLAVGSLGPPFTLSASSPCINAGKNTIQPLEDWRIVFDEDGKLTSTAYYNGTLWVKNSNDPYTVPYSPYDIDNEARDAIYDIGADEYYPTGNQPPEFTSTPVTSVENGSSYSYTATANDPDGDQVVLSSKYSLPSWLTFQPSTGLLTGTANEVETYNITLVANDGQINTEQSFTITTTPVTINTPPVFLSNPPRNSELGDLWSYHINVHDNDLNATDLEITIVNKPNWMTLNDNTGGNGHYQFVATHEYIYLRNNTADTTTVNNFQVKYGDSIIIPDFNLNSSSTWETYTADPRYSAVKIDQNTFHSMNDAQSGGFFSNGLTIGNKYTVDFETDNPNCQIANGIVTQDRWYLSGSPILSGVPSESDIGDHTVKIQVSDGVNTTTQEFTVTVGAEPNNQPLFNLIKQVEIISSDSTTQAVTISIGESELITIVFLQERIFEYTISATDSDDDPLSYEVEGTLPEWISFNDNNNDSFTITGAPLTLFSSFNITVKVTDGKSTTSQIFKIIPFTVSAEPTE